MVGMTEKEFQEEIVHIVQRLGYEVQHQSASFGRTRYTPDLVVGRSGKHVAIEIKTRPVMLSDVAQVGHYKHRGLAGTLLCVPSHSLDRTPKSVRSYAKQMNIKVCGTEDIGHELKSILS